MYFSPALPFKTRVASSPALATRAPNRILVGLALTSSLLLGACSGAPNLLESAGLTEKPAPQSNVQTGSLPQTELQKATEYWGKQYAKNPGDVTAAVNYIRNLRAMGAKQQALQISAQAYSASPDNKTLASEYGRLALEQDQLSLASKLLEQAEDPLAPDWKTISARGTVMAKQNRYREAIIQFERARTLAPTQSSVLNNLALAYTMDGHPEKAEPLLRQAAADRNADPKVSQNLSLVLGLQGKTDDARAVVVKNMPDDEAGDDVKFVSQMVGAPASAPPPAPFKTSSIKVPPAKAAPKTAAKPEPQPEDPSVIVKRLADGYTATPPDAPIQLKH